MQSLFSLDSPIMRAMSRLADLVGLNLLFLLTSIPIFTTSTFMRLEVTMQSLFSLDSPIMRAMSRLADLVGLNLLFLLTSIPIFTIGPGLALEVTMQSLFSLDSPIMRAMSRLADLVGLNLLFLLTSIPIFTIGPGLAAMYTVVFRMGTSREHGVVKPYFRAFAANFRQGTVLWLLVLVAVIGTLVDINVLLGLAGALRNLYLLACGICICWPWPCWCWW